jgi:hypothetical protein
MGSASWTGASTWTVPTSRAKNGASHIVPLAGDVVAELARLALNR